MADVVHDHLCERRPGAVRPSTTCYCGMRAGVRALAEAGRKISEAFTEALTAANKRLEADRRRRRDQGNR